MQKILITGASGLLGRAVMRQFAKSRPESLFAVTTGRKNIVFPEGVTQIQADLLREDQRVRVMEEVKPDLIIHLAWGVSQSDFLFAPENLLWLQASLHLLSLFSQLNGGRFIFAGSSAEYGESYPLCSEHLPLKPVHLYGRCKASFAEVARMFCLRNDIGFTDIRYFSVYGEHDVRPKRAIPDAIRHFQNGEPFLCKSPDNVWDYIYVQDAAKATEKIIDSGFRGMVNVASGRPRSMRDVFSEIARQMNCERLLRFSDSGEHHTLVADTSLLNRTIGFRCETPFEQGLEKTIRWWKEQADRHERI